MILKFISGQKVGGQPHGFGEDYRRLRLQLMRSLLKMLSMSKVALKAIGLNGLEKPPGMPSRISPQVEPFLSFGVFYNGCLLAQI